ncbi:hypothetical protein BE17_10230 [Sorangium cellulosum]|uniref:Uncharacterized protein n=1 Tax=Sorangium cellulosum TaxID=56 RepID=A0A150R7E7_SORCE|nr:hypothetical protein BE17_10230 [Sorangium cellulosum]
MNRRNERGRILGELRRHVVQDLRINGQLLAQLRHVLGLERRVRHAQHVGHLAGIGGLAGLVLLDLVGGSRASSSSFGGPWTPPGGFKVDDGFVSME